MQLAIDGLILLGALWIVAPALVATSLLAAFVLNLSLTVNHKPGRYRGM